MYSQQFTFTQIKAVATKARAISQFVHLCSGFVQIRFVAAELIRHSFTLCVCVLGGFGGSGQIKRWKIHGWRGRGESRPGIELLHWTIMLTSAARGTVTGL